MTFMGVQGPGWCPWCDHMVGGGWIMMISWILLLVLLVADPNNDIVNFV